MTTPLTITITGRLALEHYPPVSRAEDDAGAVNDAGARIEAALARLRAQLATLAAQSPAVAQILANLPEGAE